MKKLLGLTIAFILLTSMTGIGTWAYFSDVETSSNNQMAAGTLDLKTNDVDGVSETISATNMAPGNTVGPQTINLKNTGSINASGLDLSFSYIESDGTPNVINMSADETAAMIQVITLNYGGVSILDSISDGNANAYKDIQDLKNTDLSGLSGIGGSSTKAFEIAVQLRPETGNDYQADGITITMTFTLNQ
ncbi:MAG: TasA family protein [Dehalococcoidales bacterium]|nr:TasA family protein [Dehalococcoidales bacterium]